MNWTKVHFPIEPGDPLPPERKIVAVWCDSEPDKSRGIEGLPYCGYLRYASGDKDSPFFVVYHGNHDRSTRVVAWCDCLPIAAPEWVQSGVYNDTQPNGRGFPARAGLAQDEPGQPSPA